MTTILNNSGIALALAWPQTYCKQAGAWYDPLMGILKISKNNYYKVGHAALILIKDGGTKCHYFDFGRYHSPKGFGRVRNEGTDHELILKTIPKIINNKLINYDDLLTELQGSDVFHGEGDLYASYIPVNFIKAYAKAMQMQNESPIAYGPFVKNGTNCSRFVSTVIQAGLPLKVEKFKLRFFVPFTPSPASNVKALTKKTIKPKTLDCPVFTPQKLEKQILATTLQIPNKPNDLPDSAQWLSGEGSGSWFCFLQKSDCIQILRYSPKGKLECMGLFQRGNNSSFKLPQDYKVTHSSNCQKVSILIKNKKVVLIRM